jgi:hypothetical protein
MLSSFGKREIMSFCLPSAENKDLRSHPISGGLGGWSTMNIGVPKRDGQISLNNPSRQAGPQAGIE